MPDTATVGPATRMPPASAHPRRAWLLPMVLGAVFLVAQALDAWRLNGLGVGRVRTNWDGVWYLGIADHGYPTGGAPGAPPLGFDAYAFHPLYPVVVRAVSGLSGLPTMSVAPWVNLALALAAIVVLARWAAARMGSVADVTVVVSLVVWPSSPVFQLAYTEGLALLLLVLTWQLVDEGRWAGACLTVALLSLARPLSVPLAVTVAVLALVRWRTTRSWRSAVGPGAVVLSAGLATVAWVAYAGLHSGDPGVYWAAHHAFARPGAPSSPLLWGLQEPLIGVLVLLVLVMTTVIGTKVMPRDVPLVLRAWVVVYPPYLLAGSLVTSSLVRYFMLAFPASLAVLPLARHRILGPVVLVAAVLVGIVGVTWWIPEFVPPVADGTFP